MPNEEMDERLKVLAKLPKKKHEVIKKIGVENVRELIKTGHLTNLILSCNQVQYLAEMLEGSQLAFDNLEIKGLTEEHKRENQVLLNRFQAELLLMQRLQFTPEKRAELEQNFKDTIAEIQMAKETILKTAKEHAQKLTDKYKRKELVENYDIKKWDLKRLDSDKSKNNFKQKEEEN